MTKVLIIASEKGGLGRTTMVKHIGCVLAMRGHKVVAVDTDTQGSLTYELGVQVDVTQGDLVLYDFINRKRPFSEVLRLIRPDYYCAPDHKVSEIGELLLLPSNEETMHIAALNTDSLLFRSRINQIKSLGYFDVILIDTSPAPGMIHPPIYKTGDGILFLAVPEASPVRQLYQTMNHLKNVQVERVDDGLSEIEVVGVLPNKVKRRTSLHELFLDELRQQFGEDMVFPPVYDHIAWAEASYMKKSVQVSHPNSEAANLAQIIGNRIERWLEA